MKEYELPDPKVDPLRALVISFKTLKGVHFDDRTWDKINFGRATKSAKLLLDVCETFPQAERCLSTLAKQFNDADLAWTLETIVKHSHDWLQKNGEQQNGTDARTRLFDAIAKRRAKERFTKEGELLSTGEIVSELRDMRAIPDQAESSRREQTKEHGPLLQIVDGNQGQRQHGGPEDDAAKDSRLGGLGA